MATVGIALGSNLGEKLPLLQSARDALRALITPHTDIIFAPIYRTSPVHCPEGSPDFYNTVLEIHYSDTPEALLLETQAIETLLGRLQKRIHNEARCLDIDILYFDELIHSSPDLQIPHPRLHQRRFVLEPLTEICPERVLPNQTLTIRELLEQLGNEQLPLEKLQASW